MARLERLGLDGPNATRRWSARLFVAGSRAWLKINLDADSRRQRVLSWSRLFEQVGGGSRSARRRCWAQPKVRETAPAVEAVAAVKD